MIDKKIRILHAAVSMNPSIGVINQMEWEQAAAFDLNIPWEVALHTPKNVESKVIFHHQNTQKSKFFKYILLRINFYKWLKEVEKNYDLILLRHSVHDVFEAFFTREFGHKLITVHHTLEMPELLSGGGVISFCKSISENFIGKYSLQRCAGIIGVTEEIVDFEKKRISNNYKINHVYPNGIKCSNNKQIDARREVPEILFIAANFPPWHGLDLLLDQTEIDNSECKIHIVGDVPEALMQRCQRDSRFILHGTLSNDQIAPLMERAWCGLSSFALFRKQMHHACTLKVREYLASGLPVYSGHKDSGLSDDFKYYKSGDANISKILDFARENRLCDKNEIYQSAKKYISKEVILKNLYMKLNID